MILPQQGNQDFVCTKDIGYLRIKQRYGVLLSSANKVSANYVLVFEGNNHRIHSFVIVDFVYEWL
jgi:hypothetical protein